MILVLMSEGLPVGEVTIPCASIEVPDLIKEYNKYMDAVMESNDPETFDKSYTFAEWLREEKGIPALETSTVDIISINDGYWYT